MVFKSIYIYFYHFECVYMYIYCLVLVYFMVVFGLVCSVKACVHEGAEHDTPDDCLVLTVASGCTRSQLHSLSRSSKPTSLIFQTVVFE